MTRTAADANDGKGVSHGELLTGALSVAFAAAPAALISAQTVKNRSKMPCDVAKEIHGPALRHCARGLFCPMLAAGALVRANMNVSTWGQP